MRYPLKLKGVHHSWSEIVCIMNTQKSVTTTVENKKGQTIHIRQYSEPTGQVEEICRKLKYTTTPFPRKKSVWYTGTVFKNKKIDCQLVMDG
jgi:hypothetical protein